METPHRTSWCKKFKSVATLCYKHVKYLERGIRENASNAILIKVNQIGTLTETVPIEMAKEAWFHSNRFSPFW